MSLSSLPPEVLFTVIRNLKRERQTLRNLRLVSKATYFIATEVVFEDLSLNYGVDRCIAQMKGVTASAVLYNHVRTLFVPSESFFPISKDFRFPETSSLTWTRNPPESAEPHPAAVDVANQRRYTDMHANPDLFLENPNRSWVNYSLKSAKSRAEHDDYSRLLTELLTKCGNLKSVHIAVGFFWNADRMNHWAWMFADSFFEVLANSAVEDIEISVPEITAGGMLSMLEEYGEQEKKKGKKGQEEEEKKNAVMFPNITSFTLNIASPSHEKYRTSAIGKLHDFFAHLPNLTSFTLSPSYPRSRFDILPPRSTVCQLKSLDLSNLNVGDHMAPDFTGLLRDCGRLESLTLHMVRIIVTNNGGSQYGSAHNHRLSPYNLPHAIPVGSFRGHIPMLNWGEVFSFILEHMKHLKEYKFSGLVYGKSMRRGMGMWPSPAATMTLLPMSGEYNPTLPEEFRESLDELELVSPFPSDVEMLAEFKRVVDERRESAGLKELRGDKEGHDHVAEEHQVDSLKPDDATEHVEQLDQADGDKLDVQLQAREDAVQEIEDAEGEEEASNPPPVKKRKGKKSKSKKTKPKQASDATDKVNMKSQAARKKKAKAKRYMFWQFCRM